MTQRITLQSTLMLTHDTRYYVFSKPGGYSFTPGQATELALDKEGWREETRSFTFVSKPEADILAFVIKSYPDHDGVTERFGHLRPGDQVLLNDAWGAIADRGPGTFIAAAAGITPFIPILTERAETSGLEGSTLLYANKTEADVILRPYWDSLPRLQAVFALFNPTTPDMTGIRIDQSYLETKISDWSQTFYLCGPESFEDDITKALQANGVADKQIIRDGVS